MCHEHCFTSLSVRVPADLLRGHRMHQASPLRRCTAQTSNICCWFSGFTIHVPFLSETWITSMTAPDSINPHCRLWPLQGFLVLCCFMCIIGMAQGLNYTVCASSVGWVTFPVLFYLTLIHWAKYSLIFFIYLFTYLLKFPIPRGIYDTNWL